MFELASLGIGYGSLLMLLMLIVLLLTGMQLAFATGLVALVFALGWFGPDALPGDSRWRRGEAVSMDSARNAMVGLEAAAHASMIFQKRS